MLNARKAECPWSWKNGIRPRPTTVPNKDRRPLGRRDDQERHKIFTLQTIGSKKRFYGLPFTFIDLVQLALVRRPVQIKNFHTRFAALAAIHGLLASNGCIMYDPPRKAGTRAHDIRDASKIMSTFATSFTKPQRAEHHWLSFISFRKRKHSTIAM